MGCSSGGARNAQLGCRARHHSLEGVVTQPPVPKKYLERRNARMFYPIRWLPVCLLPILTYSRCYSYRFEIKHVGLLKCGLLEREVPRVGSTSFPT